MKRIWHFVAICLFLLSGCHTPNTISHDPFVAVYNGNIYDEVDNWYPVNEDYKTVSVWIGFENDISEPIVYSKQANVLKTDTDCIGLVYDNKLSDMNYFIKRDTNIPQVYKDAVQKIVLVNDSANIELRKDGLVSYLEFLKQCYSDKSSYVVEEWEQGSPDMFIYVYFQDFPLYYYYGYFGRLESGKYGFSSWDFQNYNTHGIVIPDNITNQILQY